MVNVLKSAGEGISKAGRVVKDVPRQVVSAVSAYSGAIKVAALMVAVGGNAGCLVEFPARKGGCNIVGAGTAAGCDNENEVCRINMEAPNDPTDLTCYDRTEYCEYTAKNNINDIACPLSDALPFEDATLPLDIGSPTPDSASVSPDAAPKHDGNLPQDAAPKDAMIIPGDGGRPPLDAGEMPIDGAPTNLDSLPPTPDAAELPADAATPTPDALAPNPDATQPIPDAAELPVDAVVPTPDAAQPIPDAIAPTQDAAELPVDAGAPAPDFAIIPIDASIDATVDAAIDASIPDAEIIAPQDYCRIQIIEVLGGAGNIQVFCGPNVRQDDGDRNEYVLANDLGICNPRVQGVATEAWTLIGPTRTTFQQTGDCTGLRVFSGDRTSDIPTNEPPGPNAQELRFIENPPLLPRLTVDGAGRNLVVYFDARDTNITR